jgi:hypothetical protein
MHAQAPLDAPIVATGLWPACPNRGDQPLGLATTIGGCVRRGANLNILLEQGGGQLGGGFRRGGSSSGGGGGSNSGLGGDIGEAASIAIRNGRSEHSRRRRRRRRDVAVTQAAWVAARMPGMSVGPPRSPLVA